MKTTSSILILITAVMITFLSCKSKPDKKAASHENLPPNTIEMNRDQLKVAGIQVGKVEQRTIRSILKVNGTINVTPQDRASVSAPLGGFVKNTHFVQGSAVTKGQILAMIENFTFIELQQDYLETKAKFDFAAIEFRRHSELYKENVYSEKNLQQTETEYKTLKAQLNSLEQKLDLLGIEPSALKEDKITGVLPVVAPITGFLKSVNINMGKYVSPTDVMFEIVNPENLVLELVVFEKDVHKVAPGQKVIFSTPNDPSRTYSATLYQAGKALDNDKTSMAYASISQAGKNLLPGMYVNAEIEMDIRSVLCVPQDAVVQFYEKFYIFRFKGKRTENGKEISDFEAVEVTKGISDQGFTEIALPPGFDLGREQIVVKGTYAILSAWKNAGEMAC